jgi:hypothetical protein
VSHREDPGLSPPLEASKARTAASELCWDGVPLASGPQSINDPSHHAPVVERTLPALWIPMFSRNPNPDALPKVVGEIGVVAVHPQ